MQFYVLGGKSGRSRCSLLLVLHLTFFAVVAFKFRVFFFGFDDFVFKMCCFGFWKCLLFILISEYVFESQIGYFADYVRGKDHLKVMMMMMMMRDA